MPKTLSRWAGFRDRFGERDVVDDQAGQPIARLRMASGVVAPESAFVDRIARLAAFDSPALARSIALERDPDTGRLTLFSDYVPGIRLSDALHRASTVHAVPDLAAGLFVVRRLLSSLCRANDATGLTHFAVAAERVIATPRGDVVLVEVPLAVDIEARARGAAVSDPVVDIGQIARLGLSMVFGRLIPDGQYLDPLSSELDDLSDVTAIRSSERFASALRLWFEQALVTDRELSFRDFGHARAAFCAACVPDAGCAPSRRLFGRFLNELTIEDFKTPETLELETRRARAARARVVERRWHAGEADGVPLNRASTEVLDDLLEEIAGGSDDDSADAWSQQQIESVRDMEIVPDLLLTVHEEATTLEITPSEPFAQKPAAAVDRTALDGTEQPVAEALGRNHISEVPDVAPPEEPQAQPIEAVGTAVEQGRGETTGIEITARVKPVVEDAGEALESSSDWIRDALLHVGEMPTEGEPGEAADPEEAASADIEDEPSFGTSAGSDEEREHGVRDTSLSWLHDVLKQMHMSSTASDIEARPDDDQEAEPEPDVRTAVEATATTHLEGDESAETEGLDEFFDDREPDGSAASESEEPVTPFASVLAGHWLKEESVEALPDDEHGESETAAGMAADMDAVDEDAALEAAELAEWEADITPHVARETPGDLRQPDFDPIAALLASRPSDPSSPPLSVAVTTEPAADAPAFESEQVLEPVVSARTGHGWFSRLVEKIRSVKVAYAKRVGTEDAAAREAPLEPPIPRAPESTGSPGSVEPPVEPPTEARSGPAASSSESVASLGLREVTPSARSSEAVQRAAAAIAFAHLNKATAVKATPPVPKPLPYETFLSEEPPPRRWPKRAAGFVLVAAVAYGGYTYRDRLPWPNPMSAEDANSPATAGANGGAPTRTTGALTVRSTPPGARVLIDGTSQGVTPVTIGDLKPGGHTVLIESSAGSIRRQVTVRAGETETLDEGIFAGFLAVFAPFEVQVHSRGQQLGSSDNPRIMLPPGEHTIELVNTRLGFRQRRSVVVEPGDTVVVNVESATGVVRVNAAPGAEVFVDGERVGVTPLGDLSLRVGTHEVVVRHPDLGERRMTTAVKSGGATVVTVDFAR